MLKLTLENHKLISLRLQGLEYKEISYELGISSNTVRNNFQYMYRKLSRVTALPVTCVSELRTAYSKYVYERNIDLEKLSKLIADKHKRIPI